MIPWSSGKCLTWDVTVPDTLAPSYANLSSVSAGSVAERAASLKAAKYSNLLPTYDFVAVAIESLGVINTDGQTFLRALGKRLSAVSGETRETDFLFQRLSVAIQRFNCVALKESFSVAIHGDRNVDQSE